jgi:prolyl oligopeptidase
MLRYQHFSMGAAWIPEYGSAERADEFARLWRYSPLHQVRQGVTYPALLITTADHDDRVTPAHSYKFAAALQSAQQGTQESATDGAALRPILLRVDERVGHGSGTPTSKLIAGATDSLVFLTMTLSAGEQK